MARKVAAGNLSQRRSGVNRAQLKALAARQAMTNIPARAGAPVTADEAANPALDLGGVTLSRRRVTLTRDQEYAYIRADLIRLLTVSAILLAVIVAIAFYLA